MVKRQVNGFSARTAHQRPREVNAKRAARDGHAAQRAGGSDIVAALINSRVMGWCPSKPKRRMATARSLLFSPASAWTRSDNAASSSTLKSGMRLISLKQLGSMAARGKGNRRGTPMAKGEL